LLPVAKCSRSLTITAVEGAVQLITKLHHSLLSGRKPSQL
jgi:hypothetical protein